MTSIACAYTEVGYVEGFSSAGNERSFWLDIPAYRKLDHGILFKILTVDEDESWNG